MTWLAGSKCFIRWVPCVAFRRFHGNPFSDRWDFLIQMWNLLSASQEPCSQEAASTSAWRSPLGPSENHLHETCSAHVLPTRDSLVCVDSRTDTLHPRRELYLIQYPALIKTKRLFEKKFNICTCMHLDSLIVIFNLIFILFFFPKNWQTTSDSKFYII